MHPFPRLTEFRKLRSITGWTQRQLVTRVRAAGFKFQQSQLSKIEGGDEKVKIDYRLATKVFEILEAEIRRQSKGGRRAASEVMTPRREFLRASPSNRVETLAKKMKEREISQVPVMTRERVVGTLTFQDMFGAERNALVGEHMSAPLPSYPASTTVRSLRSVLSDYQAVLLEEQGEIVGILSRPDAIQV